MRSRRLARPGRAEAGSNVAGRDTALLEALWRGDELAAALRAAQATLAARDRDLARAEERIAELNDIVEAAQAALEKLRARRADDAAARARYVQQRDAIAAELFRIAEGRGSIRKGDGENVPIVARRTLVWRCWRRMRHPFG